MAKISPETLPKTLVGLNVLVLHDRKPQCKGRQKLHLQRAATDSLDPQPEAEAELHNLSALKLTVESLHYMRLATAAYGRVSLRPGLVGITDSNFTQLLCKHVCESLNPEEVSVPLASLRARWLLPAHYVLVDRGRREVVVAVRGTLSVQDVLTDLGAEEVDLFLGGKAHKNMLQSACNVLRAVHPLLETLSGIDRITFTGHSLGGGVAAYLTMLFLELQDLQDRDDPRNPRDSKSPEVRCFSFGAPGICSAAVSKSLRDRIASYCHAQDVVPRLSTGHLLELHGRAVLAANVAGDIVKRLANGGLWKAAQVAQAIPQDLEEALASSKIEAFEKQNSGDSPDMLKLYPAGRCFLVQRDGEIEELAPEDLAPCIDFSGGRRMVVDHLPRIYEVVMKAAADRAQHAQQAQHAQTVQCAEKCAEGRRGAAPTELRELVKSRL